MSPVPDEVFSTTTIPRIRRVRKIKTFRRVWTAVWKTPVPHQRRTKHVSLTRRHFRATASTPFSPYQSQRSNRYQTRCAYKETLAIEEHFKRRVLPSLFIATHPVKT